MKRLKQLRQVLRQFLPLLMILFYIYVFPSINEFIAPYLESFIKELGIFAPIGYIFIGLIVTVFAPLGLGPANISLQQAFGYRNSLIYFFIYSFIGLMINFSLSKIYGRKIVEFFFPDMKYSGNHSSTVGIKYMYDKFEKSMEKGNLKTFFIFFGGGNELLAYLAGTTKLSFKKFLLICASGSALNTILYVTRNYYFEKNNSIFFGLEALSVFFGIIALVLIFSGETGNIKDFFIKMNTIGAEYKQTKNSLDKNDPDYKNKLNDIKKQKDLQLSTLFKIR